MNENGCWYIKKAFGEGRYRVTNVASLTFAPAGENPQSDFDYKIIDRGKAGKHPSDLEMKEQKAIEARGGTTNKSNPDGGTSNRKNVMKKE